MLCASGLGSRVSGLGSRGSGLGFGLGRGFWLAGGVPLEEADAEDDLDLGGLGERVEELDRRHLPAQLVARHLPREVDAVGVHEVTDEASHRDAAVLDLRVAQPADRLLVRVVPELGL